MPCAAVNDVEPVIVGHVPSVDAEQYIPVLVVPGFDPTKFDRVASPCICAQTPFVGDIM